MGLTWGTARLLLVGDTSGRSTRLPTLPMPQREVRGGAGKGLRKVLLGPRLRGRVWTEAAIVTRLCEGVRCSVDKEKGKVLKWEGAAKWLDRRRVNDVLSESWRQLERKERKLS